MTGARCVSARKTDWRARSAKDSIARGTNYFVYGPSNDAGSEFGGETGILSTLIRRYDVGHVQMVVQRERAPVPNNLC